MDCARKDVPVTQSNVHVLGFTDGRKEAWEFPDGTVVTMEVPCDGPPITIKHAVYCLSEIIYRIHRAAEG